MMTRQSVQLGVLLLTLAMGSACTDGGRSEFVDAGQVTARADFAPANTGLCGAERNRRAFNPEPDRLLGLSEVARRGGLRIIAESSAATGSHSVNDRSVADWRGQAPSIGGLAVYDRGEHIYSDYLYDSRGADDGADAQRYQINEGLQQAYSRTERLDQLFQALGDQFGAPAPLGAKDHYGDATDITGPHDLTELRWAVDADTLYFYARYSRLTEEDRPALALLLDNPDTDGTVSLEALGLGDQDFEHLLIVERERMLGNAASSTSSQWLPEAFVNALELAIPLAALGSPQSLRVAVIATQGVDADGDGEFESYTPANLGYRYDALDQGQTILPCEPVAGNYNDRAQAFDLLTGDISGYTVDLDLVGMRAGRTQITEYTGGYYERHIQSDPEISHEDPVALGYADASDPFEPFEQTRDQPYGLFLPYDFDPAKTYPLTFWLHYQGGKTHSAGSWSPRIIHQHGQDHQNIVVTPRARGSKSWYVGASHRDIWEVFADVAGTAISGEEGLAEQHGFGPNGLANIDPRRVYLSGYSMGGYGTYMLGLMYPDKFAAAYSTSGVHFGSALPGGAHLLENARHLPVVIQHGSFDELVPWVTIFPVATTLQQLGYRHRMYTFPGYEHYTQAIIDEWADGTTYLNRFSQPESPRHITYKVVPELVRTINNNRSTLFGAGTRTQFDFRPDGAWWIDDIVVRDDGGCDMQGAAACDDTVFALVDAQSFALPGDVVQALPTIADTDNGFGLPTTPVASPGNHSTPYILQGTEWQSTDAAALSNAYSLNLTNVASLSLDMAKMALDGNADIQAEVQSDGDTTIRLNGLAQVVDVVVNGRLRQHRAAGAISVALGAGSHQLVLRPVR